METKLVPQLSRQTEVLYVGKAIVESPPSVETGTLYQQGGTVQLELGVYMAHRSVGNMNDAFPPVV